MVLRLYISIFLLTAVFVAVNCLPLYSQPAQADSILAEIKAADSDSVKIRNYISLIKALYQEKPEDTRVYLNVVMEMIDRSDFHEYDGYAYLYLAAIETREGKYEAAFDAMDKGLEIARKQKNSRLIGKMYKGKAVIFLRQEKLAQAMSFLIQADSIFQENDDIKGLADVQTNMGVIYYRQTHYPSAKHHFYAALELFKKGGFERGVAQARLNIGVICKNQDDFDGALMQYEKALLYFKSNNQIREQVFVLNNLGSLKLSQNNPREALPYLEEAHDLSFVTQNKSIRVSTLLNIGEAHILMNEAERALPILDMAFALADSLRLQNEKLAIAGEMARALDSLDKTVEALEWIRTAFVLQDSITQRREAAELARLQNEFKMREKNEENKRLLAEKKVQSFKNLTISLCLLFVSALALILFFQGRKNVKNNKLLISHQEAISENNRILQDQNDRLETLNREKDLMMSMLAHDIRDPLSQIEGLSNVLIDQNENSVQQLNLLRHIKQTAHNLADMSQRMLDLEVAEAGRLSLEIAEIACVEVIETSIADYADKARKKGISIIQMPFETAYKAKADKKALKQIVDNLLSNAIKFSPPGTEVHLTFEEWEAQICIKVIDEGPGIEAEDIPKLFHKFQTLPNKPTAGEKSTGLGLALARKYVDAMGGDISCESVPGKGSTFMICLPKVLPTYA